MRLLQASSDKYIILCFYHNFLSFSGFFSTSYLLCFLWLLCPEKTNTARYVARRVHRGSRILQRFPRLTSRLNAALINFKTVQACINAEQGYRGFQTPSVITTPFYSTYGHYVQKGTDMKQRSRSPTSLHMPLTPKSISQTNKKRQEEKEIT